MKKNISTYLLIIVTIISFMLASCASKSEKLNELEQSQQQLQKEMTTIEKKLMRLSKEPISMKSLLRNIKTY